MEIKLFYVLTLFSFLTVIISGMTLLITNRYQNEVLSTALPGAPEATAKLTGLYLPPMVKMQVFVFVFDILILMYYVYQNPIWDNIKANIPAMAYEWKSNQEPECTSVVIICMMILFSKVSYTLIKVSTGTCVINDYPLRG